MMKQKRHRTTFNQFQLNVLEEAFKQNGYPNPAFRGALASKTNLDVSRVQVWFQNRRAKHKRQISQAMQCIAASNHHHQSFMSNHSKLEQCAALQQQMALDLHLHSANQLDLLQQQTAPSINSALTNGFVLEQLQQQQQQQQDSYVNANDNESSQLDVANSNPDLQLHIDEDSNNQCNNMLYGQHWLNCNPVAINASQQQQEDAIVANQQQQQQTIPNSIPESETPPPMNQQVPTVLSRIDQMEGFDGSAKVEPDFEHYRQQRQQYQKQNQYYSYYKQIGSQLRSTVEYLH